MAKALGLVLLVLVVDAVLLVVVGVQMQDAPPAPADAAVGKGLATLGAALGFAAVIVAIALLEVNDRRSRPAPEA
ncbi:hypothetical protein [Nocardioides deserti]|uniref:Uncharacterized protein n=1 Tax=Nocardioides deserti TaxID=1588644 RepID=A0ABR6UAH2_9ACTN|nr:hypothetical protein [Nocardioides deserti]MBC2961440.1 hypothetical protein [Nocardioides deserti]GGO78521.1 hypothetical protein GCM10012276_36130 [Nocardioides deserti]